MLRTLLLIAVLFLLAYYFIKPTNIKSDSNGYKHVEISKILDNPDYYNKDTVFVEGKIVGHYSILGNSMLVVKDKHGKKILLRNVNQYFPSDTLKNFKVVVRSLLQINDLGIAYLDETNR